MKVQILFPFIIYLFLLILIIIFTTRSAKKSVTGFFLGESKINRFVVAISSVISVRSSWLLLGVTSQAYIMGLSAVWLIAGFIISEFLLFIFLGPALRNYSEKNNCITITDVITSRFADRQISLRIVLSLVLLFFLLSFISSQLIGGGRALYAFLGLSATNGIIITGVIVLIFSFIGGFKTLNYSDILQLIIILLVILSIPLIILMRRDGFENLYSEILVTRPDFFDINSISLGTLIGFLSFGLGSTGNPHLLVKYMSIDNSRHFRSAALVNLLTNILIGGGALSVGLLARSYFPGNDSIPGADPQNIFIGLAGVVLTPVLLGLVLSSVFAAIISSAGSQALVSASTSVLDFFEKTLHAGKKFSQARLIFYSRISLVFLVYLAIIGGVFIKMDYSKFVLFAWAGLGASIGPAILFTLFSKNVTGAGILTGIITGAITVIVWKNIPGLSETIYELLPGIILSTISTLIGSSVDKNLIARKYNRKARYDDIKKTGSWD